MELFSLKDYYTSKAGEIKLSRLIQSFYTMKYCNLCEGLQILHIA